MKKILIDNGHGVNTPGKCSPDRSFLEYKYCREIAREVVARLVKLGYDAILVTPEETDISLSARVKRINSWCNKLGASNCLSISIHNNAAGGDGKWKTATGWSVYVSKNASSMGGSQIFLETNEMMTVLDLVKGICIASGNDVVVIKKQLYF